MFPADAHDTRSTYMTVTDPTTELQRAADAGKLLSPRQVSDLIGVTQQTLAHWRCRRIHLPFLPISTRCVKYRATDVLAYTDRIAVQVQQREEQK